VEELTIEPMTERDLTAVLSIDLASFPAETRGDGLDPRALREAQLREELSRAWARLRVARSSSGELLGFVLFWHVVDEIHLLNVAVDPATRRRGVGRALLEAVVAYARDNAAAKILLEVRASNAAAIALYDRLGFVRFAVRERYYPDGEDGVEMMLSLP
jgi:ribosomal-protein-alanine N-acetyltransferase